MEFLQNPSIIPLGAFVTVIALVVVESLNKLREEELAVNRELRLREMEYQQRMKELEAASGREQNHGR